MGYHCSANRISLISGRWRRDDHTIYLLATFRLSICPPELGCLLSQISRKEKNDPTNSSGIWSLSSLWCAGRESFLLFFFWLSKLVLLYFPTLVFSIPVSRAMDATRLAVPPFPDFPFAFACTFGLCRVHMLGLWSCGLLSYLNNFRMDLARHGMAQHRFSGVCSFSTTYHLEYPQCLYIRSSLSYFWVITSTDLLAGSNGHILLQVKR